MRKAKIIFVWLFISAQLLSCVGVVFGWGVISWFGSFYLEWILLSIAGFISLVITVVFARICQLDLPTAACWGIFSDILTFVNVIPVFLVIPDPWIAIPISALFSSLLVLGLSAQVRRWNKPMNMSDD